VVVDRLTKYAHFCGIQSAWTTSEVVEVFMKEIHRIHGFTKEVVCDRDPKFIGFVFEKVMEDEWNKTSYEFNISSTNR
jgi:hypothetical protein